MPRSYKIKSDNKDMTFTPGENGSLIYTSDTTPTPVFNRVPSKTVPSPYVSEKMKTKKNRMNLGKTLVAATRG